MVELLCIKDSNVSLNSSQESKFPLNFGKSIVDNLTPCMSEITFKTSELALVFVCTLALCLIA